MSKTRLTIFRCLMLLYLAAVAYLCFGHFESLPKVSNTILGIPTDKVVHFCMFLPFPVLLFLCYDKITTRPWQAVLLAMGTFAIGAAIAASTEIIQGRLGYRSQDPLDFCADAIALALSSLVVYAIDLRQMHSDNEA